MGRVVVVGELARAGQCGGAPQSAERGSGAAVLRVSMLRPRLWHCDTRARWRQGL